MLESFDSLPTAIFAQEILSYLSSKDYLALRAASKWFHTALHKWDEADTVWTLALKRDFAFEEGSDCLQTLRERYEYEPAVIDEPSRPTLSVFGYTAGESIYMEDSAFLSWKQWKRISQIYFNASARKLPRANDNFLTTRDPSLKDRNVKAPYFLRAAKAWAKVEQWLDDDPSTSSDSLRSRIKKSLMNGVNHNEGRFHKKHTRLEYSGVTEAFGAIFAFYDGQCQPREHNELCSGLFGGYSAYNNWTSSRLLDTATSILEVMDNTNNYEWSDKPITINLSPIPKQVTFNCNSGELVLFTASGPQSAINLPNVCNNSTPYLGDAGLLWFEEFTRRLSNNEMSESEELNPGDKWSSILTLYPTINARYPRTGTIDADIPITSRAVTKGIEIVASSVLAIEMGGYHVYSIRIRLLLPGEEGYQSAAERGFVTCQLRSRHWRIKDDENGGTVQSVDGDGVIGYYPLLKEGGYRNDSGHDAHSVQEEEDCEGTFVYQSCSEANQGSFSGSVLMVPGSLKEPKGTPFHAIVAPFALDTEPNYRY